MRCFLWSVFFCITFLHSYTSHAQVSNNDIRSGTILTLNDSYTESSTNHATVEWACINKSLRSLTHKCLIYHNDQWFTFRVGKAGKYYLNIASQTCRDGKGIQAIVLEGSPCETKAFRIIQCIAQIRDGDVFIALDSLQPSKDYFVNIDGFLGDFCNFKIQFSTEATGFSHHNKNLDTLALSGEVVGKTIQLQWTVSEALQETLTDFEIYRRLQNDRSPILIGVIPVALNTIGTYTTHYTLADSLRSSGQYIYEVVGISNVNKVKQVLDRQVIDFRPSSSINPFINISLEYKSGTKVQLLLVDEMRDVVLKQTSFVYDAKRDANQKIYIGHYLDEGITSFLVVSTNLKTFEKRIHKFTLSARGEIERQ